MPMNNLGNWLIPLQHKMQVSSVA